MAHLIYTSGSSGHPKAVACNHLGSVLSHAWRTALCPLRPGDLVGVNIFGTRPRLSCNANTSYPYQLRIARQT